MYIILIMNDKCSDPLTFWDEVILRSPVSSFSLIINEYKMYKIY